MPNMQNIKTKLDSVSNMKQLFNSMESSDFEKLKKVENQVVNFKSFMEDFLGILGSVDLNSFRNRNINSVGKKLILVFSTDKGFCGDYNYKLFKRVFNEYSDDIENIDVFCVGKRSFEFFAKKGFNIVGYLKIADEFGSQDLSEVYDYFVSGVANNTYSDISLYLNIYKNNLNSKIVNYNVYPIDDTSLSTFVTNLGLDLSKFSAVEGLSLGVDSQEFKIEMEKQLIQYMLYGAALQNKVAELKSRISVLQNVKNNSEYVVKDLKLSFNRLCQSLLTREVSSIMELKTSC